MPHRYRRGGSMHRFAIGPWLQQPRLAHAAAFSLVLVLSHAGYCLSPPPVTGLDDFFVYNSKGVPHIPDDWLSECSARSQPPAQTDP